MHKVICGIAVIGGISAAVVGLTAPAHAATHRVPGDFGRITTAVHNAAAGDTILVGPGTYHERFTVRRNMVIRGEAGAEATIINGSVAPGNVISLGGVSSACIIEDLTITGGTLNTADPESTGAAIYVNEGDPIVQRCLMTGNRSNSAAGVVAYFFAHPTIRDCRIYDNSGGGIWVETDLGTTGPPFARIENTTIVRNAGFGFQVLKGGKAQMSNCTIAFNVGDGVRAERDWARVEVTRTIIAFNGGAGIRRYTTDVCFVLSCNDVFENEGGQWVGTNSADECFPGRGRDSVQFDPGFCNASGNDFRLASTSPLLVFCQGGCGPLGADPDCMGASGCTTGVRSTTWSLLKSRFRDH